MIRLRTAIILFLISRGLNEIQLICIALRIPILLEEVFNMSDGPNQTRELTGVLIKGSEIPKNVTNLECSGEIRLKYKES